MDSTSSASNVICRCRAPSPTTTVNLPPPKPTIRPLIMLPSLSLRVSANTEKASISTNPNDVSRRAERDFSSMFPPNRYAAPKIQGRIPEQGCCFRNTTLHHLKPGLNRPNERMIDHFRANVNIFAHQRTHNESSVGIVAS